MSDPIMWMITISGVISVVMLIGLAFLWGMEMELAAILVVGGGVWFCAGVLLDIKYILKDKLKWLIARGPAICVIAQNFRIRKMG